MRFAEIESPKTDRLLTPAAHSVDFVEHAHECMKQHFATYLGGGRLTEPRGVTKCAPKYHYVCFGAPEIQFMYALDSECHRMRPPRNGCEKHLTLTAEKRLRKHRTVLIKLTQHQHL